MKIGAVVYATDQGLGHLGLDFYRNGVIDDVAVFRHPSAARETHLDWYPPGVPVFVGRPFGTRHHAVAKSFLERIDVLLSFETPFCWEFANYSRSKGVKTALMPMLEWFPEQPRHKFDSYLCPSLLDLDVFTGLYGADRCAFIPVPAPDCTWTRRTTARRFLHNAGHVGSRNHKGTDTLLRAMEFVESPIELTVRCQDKDVWQRLVSSAAGLAAFGDKRVTVQLGNIPRADLFPTDHDVYVAPERYNGLSLPLQEAFAHGMPVVTTDRYPANAWLPTALMVRPTGYNRVRVAPGYLEMDEAQVNPRDLARVMDWMYQAPADMVMTWSDAGRDWAAENSWAVLGPKYRAALEGLL